MGYRTYTCPIARRCGGCEWLAVPYPIQLERKQRAVKELLGTIVSADGGELRDIRGMAEPCAYRHKAATPFAPGRSGVLRHGFYAAGSHRIVACRSCLVEHPACRPVFAAVAREAARLHIPAYDEDRHSGCLRHAVMRVGRATGESLLTLVTNGPQLPRAGELARRVVAACPDAGLVGVVQNINARPGNAILGRTCRTLWGAGFLHDDLLGCRFEVGPTAFFQTNPEQTELLYRLVLDALGLPGAPVRTDEAPTPDAIAPADGRPPLTEASSRSPAAASHAAGAPLRVLDAYCGCGTIGICVAAAAAHVGTNVRVTGVEQVSGAVAAARRNAEAAGVAALCRFVRADATAYLADAMQVTGKRDGPGGRATRGGWLATATDARAGRDGSPATIPGAPSARRKHGARDFAADHACDALILDPPRAGSTPRFLDAVCALAPELVVYVSCNIATQARDLEVLRAGGYRVTTLTPVDLFPHTRHVEAVAVLHRR